jgi:hypothetical protein
MRIHVKMPLALKPFYMLEIENYRIAMQKSELSKAWKHLERAHVIGQAYPLEHSVVHSKMLWFGIRIKSAREVIGQLPRLLVGGVKSFVGVIPVGNTGGANVPPLKPMAIEPEIRHIFQLAGIEKHQA